MGKAKFGLEFGSERTQMDRHDVLVSRALLDERAL